MSRKPKKTDDSREILIRKGFRPIGVILFAGGKISATAYLGEFDSEEAAREAIVKADKGACGHAQS